MKQMKNVVPKIALPLPGSYTLNWSWSLQRIFDIMTMKFLNLFYNTLELMKVRLDTKYLYFLFIEIETKRQVRSLTESAWASSKQVHSETLTQIKLGESKIPKYVCISQSRKKLQMILSKLVLKSYTNSIHKIWKRCYEMEEKNCSLTFLSS